MRNAFKAALVGAMAAGLYVAAGAAVAADTPVTFQLNWMAGGPNAGFAAALAEGYYKDAGLDVTLVQGNGSGNTAQLVANGRAQLAYADAVAVSQLIAKGAPMKVVSTIYQSNPNAVMSLKKAGIKTSATIAATAAIVAEFVGANKGLGYVLLRGTSTMDIELVFAVLVVLTLIGVAINYAVEFCEWAMTPWQRAKNT